MCGACAPMGTTLVHVCRTGNTAAAEWQRALEAQPFGPKSGAPLPDRSEDHWPTRGSDAGLPTSLCPAPGHGRASSPPPFLSVSQDDVPT